MIKILNVSSQQKIYVMVVKSKKKKFSVSIIPYTFEHTIFSTYKIGTRVNIEFDIIGKYVERLLHQLKK